MSKTEGVADIVILYILEDYTIYNVYFSVSSNFKEKPTIHRFTWYPSLFFLPDLTLPFINTYITWCIPIISGQTFRNGAECCSFMDFSNVMSLPVNFQLTELSGSYNARYHSLYCISYIHEVLTCSEAPLQLLVKILSHLTIKIMNTPSVRRKPKTNVCIL
jgi:hypothetical protein